MMRPCPGRDAVIGHLLVLVLTTIWLALTGLKVLEYLSEPTATKTLWKRSDYLPPFTVCPAVRTLSPSTAAEAGTTLLELFQDMALSPEDMLRDLNVSEENPSESKSCHSYGCINLKTSVDYHAGGTCLTSEAAWLNAFQLVLLPNPDFQHDMEVEHPLTYDLVFHGHPDFIADLYIEDTTYYLSTAQQGIAITVTTDRQIQVSLRRDPCTDDPNYSKRLCERQCFFDWLNCSLIDDAEANKPRCMASDDEWYEEEEPFKVFLYAPDGRNACSCPKPCVTDFITVSVQPDFYVDDDNFTYVELNSARTMKVLQTYVTYTFSDLMADTGGFLGLLLGSSILSVCQLLPKPAKWACTKCRGQGEVLSARSRRGKGQSRVSPYPVHGGDLVFRISPRADRPIY